MDYETMMKNIDEKYKNNLEFPEWKLRKTEGYKPLVDAWRNEEDRLHNIFVTDCRSYFEEELGTTLKDIAWNSIFTKAWSDGHSYGYHEVFNHLVDLVSVVKNVLK